MGYKCSEEPYCKIHGSSLGCINHPYPNVRHTIAQDIFAPPPPHTVTEEATEEMVHEKKKKEDDRTYCPIYTSMGCECKGRLTTSEWDDDDNEEINNQEEFPKWSQ